MAGRGVAQRTLGDVPYSGSGGVGDCPRLISTLGDPWETTGPRIDKVPLARPPWWRRQYRDIKQFIFLAPSKCPIDLFGPVSNGTILKQLHVTSRSSSRNPRRRSATPRLEPKNFLADSNLQCSRPETPISNQPPAGNPISNFQCPSWAI